MAVDVKIPAVGESISEATIAEWRKKDGDFVNRDDVLIVLETDKASVEVVAEETGVLKIKTKEGETVPVGTVVGTIDTSAQPSVAPPTAPPPAASKAPSSPAAGPAARRAAAELKVDLASVTATGPKGHVTKGDVLAASPGPAPSPAPMPKPVTGPSPSATPTRLVPAAGELTTREPMSKLRQTIARRLVEAQHTAAILTTFNEIDMSQVMALRAKYKEKFQERHGVGLGFMGFFVKAAIEALKAFPRVNGFIDGQDVVYNHFYHIGMAVGTERGLVVPVIRDADQMSIAEIEKSIKEFAGKAKEGKLTVDELSGGTFTISNGGVYGSLMSTPILNPPQSGILGLHKIEERPIAVGGQVVIRPMMYVALSYDHRIIDGKESVSFLVRVKEAIEDPARILLDI